MLRTTTRMSPLRRFASFLPAHGIVEEKRVCEGSWKMPIVVCVGRK